MIRIVVLLVAGTFGFLLRPQEEVVNIDKERAIQHTVIEYIKHYHCLPKVIDDEFSEQVFEEFLNNIDGRKRFLLQSDIAVLAPYRNLIDDQINNNSVEFFEVATQLVNNRMEHLREEYEHILSEPFDFTIEEYYEFDPDKKEYAKDSTELMDRWRQSLKYEVMRKVVSKQKSQEKIAEDGDEDNILTFAEIEEEAREEVKENFDDWYKNIDKVRRSDRFENYINTITHIFDPHSDYYNPKAKADFDISMGNKLEGIGARLRTDGDLTKVVSIVPGGPAWKGEELEVGDYIMEVKQEDEEDPVDIFGMRIDDVVQLIRGKKGTIVVLTIKKKDGRLEDITITRDVVELEESKAKSAMLKLDNVIENVGYIYLPKFYSSFEGPDKGTSCAADIKAELNKLKSEGAESVILDLRGNGGGSLRDVVDMSGFFIKDGPIVQSKPRRGKAYVYRDKDTSVVWDGPLIIMIDNFSASASEIISAALQDYNRALIVGTQSFGKGTVQRFLNLDQAPVNDTFKPLGDLKITMQKFYRINGGSTQLRGVVPDIILPNRYSNIDVGEREYDYALKWTEIEGLDYSQDVYQVTNKALLNEKSKSRIANSDNFKLVRKQAEYYEKNQDISNYALNLEKYKKYVQEKDEESKQFKKLYKDTIEHLEVINLTADLEKINISEETIAKNEKWIDGIYKDFYIEETMYILSDMLGSETTASTSKEKIMEQQD